MQRLLIVYNPRSSRFADVERDILAPARQLQGYLVGKYEVAPSDLEDNIARLSALLKNGDLVISAGGDATGIIASNAILCSGKSATLAALPYGNFNDLARTLRTKSLEDVMELASNDTCHGRNLYPLEIYVDGKFFRYATCYATIGMTAEAVSLYDSPKMRAKLKSTFGRKITSYTELASWYFKHRRKKQFLPEFTLNGTRAHYGTSDYAAVNGRSMARVMKGGEDYHDPKFFRSETDRLASFFRLTKLMLRSMFSRIPGTATSGDVLEFINPSTITLQTEGEGHTFERIKRIEIKKSKKCLKVIEK